ncbi:MAG TPA: hypothetical protein VGI35_06750 [Steroidobacteraceae bacterium]
MKKNPLALTVYRAVKAANDDGSSAVSAFPSSISQHLPLAARSGWDPFEVWRTRIHVIALPETPRGKR